MRYKEKSQNYTKDSEFRTTKVELPSADMRMVEEQVKR